MAFHFRVASHFRSEKLALSCREFVEFCRELWLNYSLVVSSLCPVLSFVFAVTLMVRRIHLIIGITLSHHTICQTKVILYFSVLWLLLSQRNLIIVSSASNSIVAHAFLAPVINDKSIQTKPE